MKRVRTEPDRLSGSAWTRTVRLLTFPDEDPSEEMGKRLLNREYEVARDSLRTPDSNSLWRANSVDMSEGANAPLANSGGGCDLWTSILIHLLGG